MSENTFVTDAMLKARELAREVVVCEDRRYEVRPLKTREILDAMGAIPDLAGPGASASRVTVAEIRHNAELAQSLARLALTRPKVGDGPGEVDLDMLPLGDLLAISGAVMRLSGLTRGDLGPLSSAGTS